MDTYRCVHIGQHPYLDSLRPDGFHQSLTKEHGETMLVSQRFAENGTEVNFAKGKFSVRFAIIRLALRLGTDNSVAFEMD